MAKAASGDAPDPTLSDSSPTTLAGSHEGRVIGTAAYMSPEQARGMAVDKRSDIWAFGCVLFEMLSGKVAFERDTVTDTLAAIVESEPDWRLLPASLPLPVRRLILRCLENDSKRRLRDIGDVRYEIEQVIEGTTKDDLPENVQGRRKRSPTLAVGVTLSVLVAGGAAWFASSANQAGGDRRISRFTIDLPAGQVIPPGFNSHLALSPDGTHLAFTPLPGPVYIRRLDSLQNEPLEVSKSPGFRGGPMFSPDGSSISYIEGNAIIFSGNARFGHRNGRGWCQAFNLCDWVGRREQS